MKRALVLCALAGCPGGRTSTFRASYTLDGQPRAIDSRAGGRVTCAVDRDPSDPLDPSPTFTLALASTSDGQRGPGLYFTVRGFRGAGSYQLGVDRGRAVVFDAATLADCGRADDPLCYLAFDGCALEVSDWSLADADATGARAGTGAGTFSCAMMANAATRGKVSVQAGTFSCRAGDWSGTRR